MAKDYKHRAQRSKQLKKEPVAVWKWLAVGLLIALFVAFLVFLRSTAPPDSQGTRSKPIAIPIKPTTTKAEPAKKKQPEKPASSAPRFDFYTILPEKEVVIPEHEIKTRKREEKLGKAKPTSYILQAGSFRRLKDADRRKAQLALLGMEARIESALINGKTWNRVKIGPYSSVSRVDEIRSQLRQNHIDVVVIQSKR